MVLHPPSRRASFLIWTSGGAYRGVFWFKTRQAQRPSSIPRLRGEPHTLSFQFPSFSLPPSRCGAIVLNTRENTRPASPDPFFLLTPTHLSVADNRFLFESK